jgi:uncharacterized protein YggE
MTMKNHTGTLQVSGTGRMNVMPDEAEVHLVVLTEGQTASEATVNNAKCTQATIDAVSAQPNHGVSTTGPSLNPIMLYDATSGAGTIVGFRATNGVDVKTKIGHAGHVYDAGIKAGANQSSGITFRVQDETPFREEALRIAVEQACKEAKIVAKAAKVNLAGPESIQINANDGRVFYRAQALNAKEVSTPTIPDELTISATVQILFRTHD